MSIAACVCQFRRDEDSAPENGIAVTTAFGENNVVVIVPWDATTRVDAVDELWSYTLDWRHAIDTSGLDAFKT